MCNTGFSESITWDILLFIHFNNIVPRMFTTLQWYFSSVSPTQMYELLFSQNHC
jgi:hypothetical protein